MSVGREGESQVYSMLHNDTLPRILRPDTALWLQATVGPREVGRSKLFRRDPPGDIWWIL